MRSYVIVQRSNNLEATAKQEILGTPDTRAFSQYGDGSSIFYIFSSLFICKNERILSHGVKFKAKVDLKEKITERYPGEVYQGISRCVERRSITRG